MPLDLVEQKMEEWKQWKVYFHRSATFDRMQLMRTKNNYARARHPWMLQFDLRNNQQVITYLLTINV